MNETPTPNHEHTYDQSGQAIHGSQTNIAGNVIETGGGANIGRDQHVYNYYGQSAPSPLSKRCDFYQHVHLPSNYVLRPELLAEIKRTLLQSQQDIALTSSVLQSDALFGMGGIGKTVMARALCDDAEVRAAFPDGILWATLGQTPDLPARLRDWARALGGTVPQTAPTLEELTNILAQSLAERHCLLIVDDVWDQAHLEHFMVHVQGCRLLFTTRNAEIANELNATIRPVPVMSLREAIALLVEWAGTSVASIPQTQQAAIVERLGRLPLALKLAGDQLRRRDPEKWLASFDARELRKRHIGNLHDSLENTFNLSLTDLTDIERQLYISLSIFKEDEAVVFPAVDKLWAELAGYNTNHTVDLLHFLNDRALLELADAQGNQAEASRDTMLLVTFHDLIRDLMRVELGTEERHAGHVALLAAYRRSQKNKGWPSAPNDGYLYKHLVYHLGEIATHNRIARQELLDLFANHRWLHVRVPATGYRYDGYIADLEQVWTLYYQQSHPEARATGAMTSLPVHLRFALLRTSINSLAANYAPSLVGYAVELGIWPTERALSIFAQTPDPLHKAQLGCAFLATGKLIAVDQARVLQQSLNFAAAVTPTEVRLRVQLALYPFLPEGERDPILRQLLAAIPTLPSEWLQVKALALLLPLLPPVHHSEALKLISNLKNLRLQVEAAMTFMLLANEISPTTQQALAALTGTVNDSAEFVTILHRMNYRGSALSDRSVAILKSIFEISTSSQSDQFLQKLTTLLNGDQKAKALEHALAAALAIQGERQRNEILMTLAPHLSDRQKAQALGPALTAALAIKDEWRHAEALTTLVPHLNAKQKAQVLAAALAIQDEGSRAQALMRLVPHLKAEQKAQALATALATQDEGNRAEVLVTLAPHLSAEQKAQALATALAIKVERRRAHVLMRLVTHLSAEQKAQVVSAALAIQDEWRRAQVLMTLVPHLNAEQKAQALAAALAIQSEWRRAEALMKFVPHLNAEQKVQALGAALAIQGEERRVHVLTTLVPHLNAEQKVQALGAALAIQGEERRAHVLTTLVSHLNAEQKAQALAVALAIQSEGRRAEVLVTLVPHLNAEQKAQALAAALAFPVEGLGAETLTTLVPHLNAERKAQVLAAALAIQDEWRCAHVLTTLVPHLNAEQKAQALAAALAFQVEGRRAHVLTTLVPHLNAEQKAQALTAALAIQSEGRRAEVLTTLVPHLNAEQKAQVLAAALAFQVEGLRAEVLTTLVPHLNAEQKAQALTAALAFPVEGRRLQALQKLMPAPSEALREQTLFHVLKAISALTNAHLRIDTLTWLVPYLPEIPPSIYCSVLQDLPDEWLRADLLELSLPYVSLATRAAVTQLLPTFSDPLNRYTVAQLLSVQSTTAIEQQVQASTIDQAIRASIAINDTPHRVKIYAALAEQLHTEMKRFVSDRIKPELDRADSPTDLTATQMYLAHCQERDQRTQLRARAIEFSLEISNSTERTKALLDLLSYLEPDEQLPVVEQLVQVVRAIREIEELSRTIHQIMQNINFTAKQEVAAIAFAYVMDTKEMGNTAPDSVLSTDNVSIELLCNAVPFLEPIFQRIAIRHVLHEVQYIDGAEPRAHALIALLPNLRGEEHVAIFYRVLSAAHAVEDMVTRFSILVKLASTDVSRRVFTEAKTMPLMLADPKAQAEAIVSLLPLANPLEKHMLLRKGLKAAFQITKQTERAATLAQYIPYVKNAQPITEEICFAMIHNLRAQAQTSKRADLLDYLANESIFQSAQLSDELLLTIADTISEICNDWVWL